MKMTRLMASAVVTLALTMGISIAAEQPQFPTPGPEHKWLQQFVGEWQAETEAYMEPGKPPTQSVGTEITRPVGEFWTITEVKSTMMNMPFMGNMTLGYDDKKGKYVGTWVDSMTGHMWQYEGWVDPTGKKLTLESEGECPMKPGKLSHFREVIEFKGNNEKIFTSSIMGDDGKWTTMMVSRAQRIK